MLYLYTDDGEVGAWSKAEPTGEILPLVNDSKLHDSGNARIFAGEGNEQGQRNVWAHPVIANGHLYLRDHEYIFAFKITK